MKLPLLFILFTALFYSCNHADKKTKSNANELVYTSNDTTSGTLATALRLSGDMPRLELTAQLKLSNSGSGAIDVQEINIATAEGVRSLPETASAGTFSLKSGQDTSLLLKFHPINDLKLYQLTGMQGDFKPGYTVLISYKIAGSDSLITLSLRSISEKNEYLDYIKKFKKPITAYSFNTKNGFNEKQKVYLKTLKLGNQVPFVYLSEQEIAISGMNFRFKGYYQQDTLHAEIFVVNHAEFPVKVIRDALDIVEDGKSKHNAPTINIEKISGNQQDLLMMEKGDRILIRFKKYLKIKTTEKENLTLQLSRAFMLTGKKALFNQDIQLLPVSNKTSE